MKKIILFVLMLFYTSVYAETFKWIDKNGVTHFSDYPPPDDQKSFEKLNSGRPSQERVQKNSVISERNRESIKETTIKAKGVSEAEKNIIIRQCIQAWQRYRTAISKRDIERALNDVSNKSKEEFRNVLQYQMKNVDLGDIKAENIEDTIARFNMTVTTKLQPDDDIAPGYLVGDSIVADGYVVFIRESDGSWKIDFY